MYDSRSPELAGEGVDETTQHICKVFKGFVRVVCVIIASIMGISTLSIGSHGYRRFWEPDM